jgi:uncharacterized protein
MKTRTFPWVRRFRRNVLVLLVVSTFVISASYVASPPPVLGVVSPNVVISQVYGGGGNSGAPYTHDFIELFNRGNTTVSLAGWSVQYTSATGTGNFGSATNLITPLSGSIAPGQYVLIQESTNAAVGSPLPAPDITDATPILMAAGAGKVALVNTTTPLGCNGGSTACSAAALATIVDLVGYGTGASGANFFEGPGAAPTISATLAAFRKFNGCQDTDNNSADFATAAPNPRNSLSALAPCDSDTAPTVTATTPANGASGVARGADITVTFSEAVNVTGSWFSISAASSGTHTATVSGGPITFTLNPDNDFTSNEAVTITVLASQVTDQDGNDPPDNMAANFSFGFTTEDVLVCGDPATPIHAIQGSGLTSPMNGATNVVIEGIVTGDYQAGDQLGGFFVQEEDGDADADPATSEGIFVFNSASPVSAGDKVRVRGTVTEFLTSGVTLTELTNVSSVTVCGFGNSVTPATVLLPVASLTDWERYEGMLVSIPQDLTVTDTFTLGRFGEVGLSVGGRLLNPTNVATPGAAAIARQDLNDRSRILLDDANGQQNIDPTRYPAPGLSASNTLRLGYKVGGLTGVLEQRFGLYRVQPVGPISFSADNQRAATPDPVGGNLKVASFNVLNYFNGNAVGGGFPTPRGANTAAEFARQRAKIISAITTVNADVVGLMEIENDPTPNSAIEDLVGGLNAATAPGTYAFINTGVVGTDEIRVAIIYRPATVTPVGPHAILNSSVDPLFIDTKNRPTLAQTFKQNTTGAKFTVVVNHLKSKGSDCNDVGDPDTGDGQGNCNQTRTKAATALVNWLATDPTGSGDPDFLIIGDLNSYAMEDPITVILNAGYTNLAGAFIGAQAYSYNFDGQSGYIDHALASASLASQVTGATEWHINADEPVVLDYNVEFKTANQVNTFYDPGPYRASDHDPVIVGLNLNDPPTVNAGGPYTVGEGGSVVVTAMGSDPNGGTLTYAWDLDNNGSFESAGQSVTFSATALDGPSGHTIKVQVTDNGGLTAVAQATVTVQNVAPSVGVPTISSEPSIKGSAVTASAIFSDPGPNDAPFTCTINYGDGSGDLAGTVSGNACAGPAHTYAAVGSYTVTVKVTDKDGDTGTNSVTHAVIYSFGGFFQPVDNLPTINTVKAGSAVPVKFSLGGSQGLSIFDAGYPKSEAIACNSTDPVSGIEETETAGSSSLSYDPATDTYKYIWKTEKAWANTCRQLVVKFKDGTFHRANFKFN